MSRAESPSYDLKFSEKLAFFTYIVRCVRVTDKKWVYQLSELEESRVVTQLFHLEYKSIKTVRCDMPLVTEKP